MAKTFSFLIVGVFGISFIGFGAAQAIELSPQGSPIMIVKGKAGEKHGKAGGNHGKAGEHGKGSERGQAGQDHGKAGDEHGKAGDDHGKKKGHPKKTH